MRNYSSVLFFLFVVFLFPSSSFATDRFMLMLAGRHMQASLPELESLAGGEDACVKRLLELRRNETHPFVGIRAEKLLLAYAEREDVQAALEEDLESLEHRGLAQIVAVHLDRVSDSAVRRHLARRVLEQGSADRSFFPYARMLRSSQDEEIQRMAKQGLRVGSTPDKEETDKEH